MSGRTVTLHEHNHFVALYDFVRGTVTLNGAINIMHRRGLLPRRGAVTA